MGEKGFFSADLRLEHYGSGRAGKKKGFFHVFLLKKRNQINDLKILCSLSFFCACFSLRPSRIVKP